MVRNKTHRLTKRRLKAKDNLKEMATEPAVAKAVYSRNSVKKFSHPDIDRGSSIRKQSRPVRPNLSHPRTTDEVLQEIAEIRKVKNRKK